MVQSLSAGSFTPALDDIEAQVACFENNSFVVLPDLLTAQQVGELNAAIDRDRKANPFMWYCETSRDYNCNLLLTEPQFEITIRHPKVLPIVERIMGGAFCFEELSVRHTEGRDVSTPTEWHRDRGHWLEHPLHLDYPQVNLLPYGC